MLGLPGIVNVFDIPFILTVIDDPHAFPPPDTLELLESSNLIQLTEDVKPFALR